LTIQNEHGPPGQAEDGTPQEDGTATAVEKVLEQARGSDSDIEEPAKLLRIAHMVRSMLDEVRTTELDEAGRARLADVHRRAVAALREVVSDDLEEELTDVADQLGDETPTGSELRVAQAQLAGWLEGLFRGIQATMAAQQQAAKQQLAQIQQEQQEGTSGSGQYL
jgi:hypothetical protein